MSLILAVLCSLLAAESWHTREAASVALRDLGSLARPHLLLSSESPDPEVRRRATDLLAEIRRREVEAWLQAQGEFPWVDSWTEYVSAQDYLEAGRAEALRRGLGTGAPNWHEYRIGTYFWLRERLQDGDGELPPLTFAEAAERLKVMRARCAAWTQASGYPPVAMPEK